MISLYYRDRTMSNKPKPYTKENKTGAGEHMCLPMPNGDHIMFVLDENGNLPEGAQALVDSMVQKKKDVKVRRSVSAMENFG